MKHDQKLSKIVDNIGKNEIKKLRHSYKQNNNINGYMYKTFVKIFKKLAFPYFRFEILLISVKDIINNKEQYPNILDKDMKKIKLIFNRLQKICFYLNIALDEFNIILSYIEKHTNSSNKTL